MYIPMYMYHISEKAVTKGEKSYLFLHSFKKDFSLRYYSQRNFLTNIQLE